MPSDTRYRLEAYATLPALTGSFR